MELENAKTRQITNPGFGFDFKAKPGFRVWVWVWVYKIGLICLRTCPKVLLSQSSVPKLVTISLYVDISLKRANLCSAEMSNLVVQFHLLA